MHKMIKVKPDTFSYDSLGARYEYRGHTILKNFSEKSLGLNWYIRKEDKNITSTTLKSLRKKIDALVDTNSINFIKGTA